MALDYQHAAMTAMNDNALTPIDGQYPMALTRDESIGVGLVFAMLAVSERLDAILGHLEEGVVGVRDADRV